MTSMGIFYGIGVGPGDPDLLTVKALKILTRTSRIFAACSTRNDYSLAKNIINRHLHGVEIERMPFPMTTDREELRVAWTANARQILEVLREGHDAAFVTLGDPLTYSTFSYLLRTLKGIAPDVKVVTVPGITSFHAAAAVSNTPLVEGEESFHLISGAKGGANLKRIIETSENVVMVKTYRFFDDICQSIEDLGLMDRAVCVTRCGLEGETVVEDLRALKGTKMPYLSLIIIKKNGAFPAETGTYGLDRLG
ncbi:MAG: precorrin-2 C(20)-methyltransferase [Thermodesulfobacteriota bacterium]